MCNKWFHNVCENLTEDLKLFSEIPEDYVCVLCRSDDAKVDFQMGMERLQKDGFLNVIICTSLCFHSDLPHVP